MYLFLGILLKSIAIIQTHQVGVLKAIRFQDETYGIKPSNGITLLGQKPIFEKYFNLQLSFYFLDEGT